MDVKRIGIISAVALGAIYLYRQYIAAKSLIFRGISINKFAWKGMAGELTLSLDFENPTAATVKVNSITLEIFYLQKVNKKVVEHKLTQANLDKFEVKKGKFSNIAVLDLQGVGIALTLFKLFTSDKEFWKKSKSFRVKGVINVGTIPIPINQVI